LSSTREPTQTADSLIHHGDVRRMLLIQKAIAEDGRALIYLASQHADKMIEGMIYDDLQQYHHWDDQLGFTTLILIGA
jgi:alkylation response protein AidB-like acyl-CoA dehydrogenase